MKFTYENKEYEVGQKIKFLYPLERETEYLNQEVIGTIALKKYDDCEGMDHFGFVVEFSYKFNNKYIDKVVDAEYTLPFFIRHVEIMEEEIKNPPPPTNPVGFRLTVPGWD